MDGNRQGARGRGRASTQNIRPGGRRPGETRQQGDRGQQPGLVPAPQVSSFVFGEPLFGQMSALNQKFVWPCRRCYAHAQDPWRVLSSIQL